MDPQRPLPELEELACEFDSPAPVARNNISTVEPYREVARSLVEQGVEMVAIHSRLVSNHGYTGSYSSVRRFVSHLRPKDDVVIRIETPPGREAQVDFGSAGMMRDALSGKMRKAYCFVMTLSYSRHQYVEFVFDQSMPTFIRCHRRAFESLGGAPREIVIDNLKAAVVKAAVDDCVLSEPYRQMARHYGILIHPCRVRTPEHKGKVESGVHYVCRNFLAGQEFMDILEANEKVKTWVSDVAGVRNHGTTHEAPLARFHRDEKSDLLPLPYESFELLCVKQVSVHRDCHVQVDGAYYSAPFAYAGSKLEAHVYERVVQLYDGVKLVVTHEKARGKGERITRQEHYPAEKSIYVTHTREFCEKRSAEIGANCAIVVETLLSERPLDRLRGVQGIIRLADSYGRDRVEAACARALFYGDPRYRRIKDILSSGLDIESEGQAPVQRSLSFYEFARSTSEFFGGAGLC